MQSLAALFAGREADFGERAVDDVPQAHQAAAEDLAGAAVDGDGASPQHVKREQRAC